MVLRRRSTGVDFADLTGDTQRITSPKTPYFGSPNLCACAVTAMIRHGRILEKDRAGLTVKCIFFRTKKAAFSAFLAACLTPVSGFAADENGTFAIKGGGLQTCEAFITAMETRSPNLSVYGGWIEGFVTAQNMTIDGFFDLTPWQSAPTMLSLMQSACRQLPPETSFARTLNALLTQLRPNALTTQSEIVALGQSGETIAMYKAVLEVVQAKLAEQGSDITDPPGTFGETTSTAIERFQRGQGLDVTGLPDQETLFRLLLAAGAPDQN